MLGKLSCEEEYHARVFASTSSSSRLIASGFWNRFNDSSKGRELIISPSFPGQSFWKGQGLSESRTELPAKSLLEADLVTNADDLNPPSGLFQLERFGGVEVVCKEHFQRSLNMDLERPPKSEAVRCRYIFHSPDCSGWKISDLPRVAQSMACAL